MTRLGRGLDALINTVPESTDRTTGITTIKIDQIVPNRYQPRKRFDQDKLQELAQSLKENGIIQPIIVTKKDDSNYELIAGERRLEAAKLAGFEDIPVIIRSVSQREQLQFAIIENVQREDLNAIEQALAYSELNELFELTHTQIAELVGKDRATVTNFIRLLKLSDNIKTLIMENKLSPGHARAILQVDDKLRDEFAAYIVKKSLSVRKAEEEAKRINKTGMIVRPKKEKPANENIVNYESTLADSFDCKVKIDDKNGSGKVSFYYSSEEEFRQILKRLLEKNE
jgi:ParB family chromosome partitioning protein